jgi:hypothetical protein
MTSELTLAQRTRALAVESAEALVGTGESVSCRSLIERLDGPLRVAIVGRVKAGKSTLLNALVRDRLAATDAGECTKVLTEYRNSHTYDVHGITGVHRVPVTSRRTDDGLQIDLPDDHGFSRIEVSWPSSTLATIALTESALLPDDRTQTEADAVVYLLRHVHERDHAFLSAFADRSTALGTPLNALAVISRSDEIGAGRLDAMVSVGRIAARLEADPRLRGVVGTVVPVAALLAESAASMTEHEMSLLRRTADEVGPTARTDLASADRFRVTAASTLGPAERERLLARYGMFGLRWSVATLSRDPDLATSTFVSALDTLSGVGAVRAHIESEFVPRAAVLKSSTALAELRRIARSTVDERPDVARRILAGVEALESSALDFTRLRVLHLVSAGLAGSNRVDIDTALQIIRRPDSVERAQALSAIDHFRRRLEDPMISPATAELCQLSIRLHEATIR